jgi:CheY-like chemotaxis protein
MTGTGNSNNREYINKMKILIAEDDEILRIYYKELMTNWSFDFELVKNGREAVNRITDNENRYDLCLMDIDMPVMDGCEATKLIRLDTKYLPIIAVTGNPGFLNKYSEFGMDACVLKPFKFNELLEKIIEITVNSGTIINL